MWSATAGVVTVEAMAGWRFWIDRGGTFTDIVALRPDGRLRHPQAAVHDPARYADAAPWPGSAALLGHAPDAGRDRRSGANGHHGGDQRVAGTRRRAHRPGDHQRVRRRPADRVPGTPRIFDRRDRPARTARERVIEVDERVAADGTILRPPDLDRLAVRAAAAYQDGIRAVAVVCMHSHLLPRSTSGAIGALATRGGLSQVSLVQRGQPADEAGAAGRHLRGGRLPHARFCAATSTESRPRSPGVRLLFMQSNGGLAEAQHFRGKDAILSGPAGGLVGMARMSRLAGFDHVIGFDMGGTSTDVSHYAGEWERVFNTQVAGVRLRAPMLAIHTVAAGGGSILHFDGSRYRVGPESAGRRPGPGLLPPRRPADRHRRQRACSAGSSRITSPGVRPDGDQPLDAEVVRRRFAELAAEIAAATGDDRRPEEVAEGFLRVAVANMANAVKKISVQKGHDITRYALTTFGGAGGQHACAVADALGIRTVLVPPMAGVLSALGIGLADVTAMREQSVEQPLSRRGACCASRRRRALEARRRGGAADAGRAGRADPGHAPGAPALRRDRHRAAGHVRRAGAMVARVRGGLPPHVLLPHGPTADRRGGVGGGGRASPSRPTSPRPGATAAHRRRTPRPGDTVPLSSGGAWREVPLYRAGAARPATRVDRSGDHRRGRTRPPWWTTVGGRRVTPYGHLRAGRGCGDRRSVASGSAPSVDPVMLEIFNNLFMSIAEQMGARLESTAQSVNIKERLDFSCALFDPDGNLIANAPHIPVHLGSMGASVKEVIRRRGGGHAARRRVRGQRSVPRRHPPARRHGHHPGLRRRPAREVLFFVASRGHHAEIGGITPGSMPAHSRNVARGGRAVRQLAAGRRRPVPRGGDPRACSPRRRTRPATRRPTSPTCAPRSPPTPKASRRSAA